MKKTIYTSLLILLTLNMFGQSTGTLKGKVIEAETKEPIPGAHVSVMMAGNKISAATDIDGKFTIKPLSTGTYNVQVTFVGLDTLRLNEVSINSDKITFLNDLAMTEGNMLTGLDVTTWTEKLIDPEDTKIVTIPAKEIARLPVRTNINAIAQAYSSEIQISEDGNEIYFRGSRNGDVIYFIDGVKISDGRPLLPSSSIQAMRVYTGGIPAKYGDMMGGVIMVETKSYFDYYNRWKAQKEIEAHQNKKK